MDVSFFDLLEERLAKGKNKNKAKGLHQLWKGTKLSNSTTIISCTKCTPDKLTIIIKFEQDELLIATILKEIYDIKTDIVIDHQFLSLISNYYITPIIGCSCFVESFLKYIYILEGKLDPNKPEEVLQIMKIYITYMNKIYQVMIDRLEEHHKKNTYKNALKKLNHITIKSLKRFYLKKFKYISKLVIEELPIINKVTFDKISDKLRRNKKRYRERIVIKSLYRVLNYNLNIFVRLKCSKCNKYVFINNFYSLPIMHQILQIPTPLLTTKYYQQTKLPLFQCNHQIEFFYNFIIGKTYNKMENNEKTSFIKYIKKYIEDDDDDISYEYAIKLLK